MSGFNENVTETDSLSSQSTKYQRVRLNGQTLTSPEQFTKLWEEQDAYIDILESKLRASIIENHKRQNFLLMRLTAKEAENQELSQNLHELKTVKEVNWAWHSDPAVNLIVKRLKQELENTKVKMTEIQEELSAWKFTSDSVTGKRLMSRCRQLFLENEDIGKMIASGRLAKLEGECALQKNLSAEMKKNQSEMDEFVQELDEDVEGMQSTIYYLQQQLKEAKEKLLSYESDENRKVSNDDSSPKTLVQTEKNDTNETGSKPESNPDKDAEMTSVEN